MPCLRKLSEASASASADFTIDLDIGSRAFAAFVVDFCERTFDDGAAGGFAGWRGRRQYCRMVRMRFSVVCFSTYYGVVYCHSREGAESVASMQNVMAEWIPAFAGMTEVRLSKFSFVLVLHTTYQMHNIKHSNLSGILHL